MLRSVGLVPAAPAHRACATSTLLSSARQDIQRQADERLALMGRAVSVSQSLFGLRSCQSPPHGCCQRSGFAAGEPARPRSFSVAPPPRPHRLSPAAALWQMQKDYLISKLYGYCLKGTIGILIAAING